MKSFSIVIVILFGISLIVKGIPIAKVPTLTSAENITLDSSEEDTNSTNGTIKELYVIKAVVYEIGILTDVPDNETELEENGTIHQQVDLSFFDADSNDTHINLGDIPLPVQTTVNGQILTGIAPFHIGAVSDLSELLQTIPLTGQIVNISESSTSFINLTKHDVPAFNQQTILSGDDVLAKIPIAPKSNSLIPETVDDAFNNLAFI